MRIFKYELELLNEIQRMQVRKGTLLCVQAQQGKIQLWSLVDDDEAFMDVDVLILGTGIFFRDQEIRTKIYLGTVQCGSYVWHVFYEIVGQKRDGRTQN